MNYVRYYIVGVWLLPLLLLFSPGHELSHRLNGLYIALVCALVMLATWPLQRQRIHISTAPLRNQALQGLHGVIALTLLLASLVVFVQLLAGGGNIRENREEFEARFQVYNYLFVLLAFAVIIPALSRYASRRLAYLARLTWLVVGCLLLLTGNRQFVFFSLVFLLFYRMGLAPQPWKTALGGLALIFAAAVGAYFFSLARLDYVQADDPSIINLYLARLTGASCSAGAFCDGSLETLFQLLYAYLGMQYSGIGYAIDYHDLTGGFPLLAVLAPVVHRRIESISMSNELSLHIDRFDQYVFTASGSDFSNFFVTMFGSAAQGGGITGMVMLACSLFTLIFLLSARLRRGGNEAVYMLLTFVCTGMVVGFMQYPLSEPFLFFGLLTLLAHLGFAAFQTPALPASRHA